MSIKVSQGFVRTSGEPIDSTLTLTFSEMRSMVDSSMPDVYFAVCKEDGKLYLYDKSNDADETTGKYRVFKSDGTKAVELTQAQYDALSTEEKMNGTIYFITDADGGVGSGDYVKGKNASISGTDNSITIKNTENREVSIFANTSSKKLTITSAKEGTDPVSFSFTLVSAYSLINPADTDSKFGGGLRAQEKNGYATIMGTVINSAVALVAKTEYKIASLQASYRPTVEINAPISHNDIATASTIRIKTNGDVCIYPPVAIATGTPMFVCVTYPV